MYLLKGKCKNYVVAFLYYKINNYITDIFLIKVDEENQRISVNIHQLYFWKDHRIIINREHNFWQGEVETLNLDGEFVERCLWTPGLQFKDLNNLDIIRPTPTSSNASPVQVVLKVDGTIQVILRNVHITVSCYMDFNGYPFDQQVKIYMFVNILLIIFMIGRSIFNKTVCFK
jgi:hypothetical protein